jgi:hypothetical protein
MVIRVLICFAISVFASSMPGSPAAQAGVGHRGHLACSHHPCSCCQPRIVVHLCHDRPEYQEPIARREAAARTESYASVPIYETMPVMPFSTIPMMMPTMFAPAAYPAHGGVSREAAPSPQTCCDQIQDLTKSLKELSDDLTRLTRIVETHGQVLEKIVQHYPVPNSNASENPRPADVTRPSP